METVRLPKVRGKMPSASYLDPASYTLVAPSSMTAETRAEIRQRLLDLLDRAIASRAPEIRVDLRETREIDASGLGVLVLLQKRAREQRLTTVLLNASEPVQRLLVLTRLDYLFELKG